MESPGRVLVCDDEEYSRELIVRLVRSMDFDVVEATNGQEALAALMNGDVRCAFLDIGLPDISGFEVARQTRASRLARRPRLVAVTGHNSSSDLAMSRKVGFDLHLVKPIDTQAILAVLSTMQIAPSNNV